ncbi:MepB family protein [Microbacterium sp. LWO13-1.2]|uniref:MepB family protein n=1 Tax=Microbacterium sp. LWO13-1.2 TaxID=3135262 RepID=UPI003138FB2E
MTFSAFETYAAGKGISASVVPEPQNSDYESGRIEIDGAAWHIRTARNTPTKPGAFVAFWRRDGDGKTVPFGSSDPAAGLLVFVEQGGGRGVFRFTAAHLAELGVTSVRGPGKRGFRLYPSWCEGLNRQAAATQRAQAPAFQEY